jgi:hypothetical protein
MKIKKHHAYCLMVLLVLCPILSFAAEQKAKAAEQAAVAWLALVDSGQYEESWSEASTLFRGQVSASDWSKAITAVRNPLGKVITRDLLSAVYTTSLPGAPDGEFVILQFQTVFKNKAQAIETVTPMIDNDKWRVSGYYIR